MNSMDILFSETSPVSPDDFLVKFQKKYNEWPDTTIQRGREKSI